MRTARKRLGLTSYSSGGTAEVVFTAPRGMERLYIYTDPSSAGTVEILLRDELGIDRSIGAPTVVVAEGHDATEIVTPVDGLYRIVVLYTNTDATAGSVSVKYYAILTE